MSLEGSQANGWKHTICNGTSKLINPSYSTLEKCFIFYSIWRCVKSTSWASKFLWCQPSLCNKFECLIDIVKIVSFFRILFENALFFQMKKDSYNMDQYFLLITRFYELSKSWVYKSPKKSMMVAIVATWKQDTSKFIFPISWL